MCRYSKAIEHVQGWSMVPDIVDGYGWMVGFAVWVDGWVRHGSMGNKGAMVIWGVYFPSSTYITS